MAQRILQFLAFLTSLHLALPAGWCCALTKGTCCDRPTTTAAKEPAPNCCCCPAEETTEPTPDPTPPPEKSWCCEREPTILSSSDFFGVDLSFAHAVDLFHPVPKPSLSPAKSDRTWAYHSPPLNVLHCVWLC